MLHPLRQRTAIFLAALLALVTSAAAAPPGASDLPGDQSQSAQLDVQLEQWGVGGRARPGSWAAIQLAIRDNSDRPREVAVRLHTTDADGDKPVIQRVVTSQPGQWFPVWLYQRVPWQLSGAQLITVHEASRTSAGRIEVGRQIGFVRIQTNLDQLVDPNDAMICVVGDSTAAIEQYAIRSTQYAKPVTSHGGYTIARLDPNFTEAFPDDWRGWSSFETIIWTSGDPSQLGADLQANALREWVARGGHLVVIIPSVGSTWHDPTNPLAELLPAADIRRHEDARLAPYKRWFTTPQFEQLAPAARQTIHSFAIDPDTPPADASEIIRGPLGPVAVRRSFGIGMVTLIGIDITSSAVARSGALRADAFWHRILGKRFDVLTPEERAKYEGLANAVRNSGNVTWVDRGISPTISKEETASIGVLLSLIVFITYWVVAGPLGFAILKRKGIERHAWLAFVATAALFTAIAWVGAATLRLQGVSVDHLTILDHVYTQPNQRARVWASVFLPKYGEESVTLGDPDADSRFAQSLAPWTDPRALAFDSFPDAREYTINTRDTDSLTVPARSTVKQFVGDWAGGPRWEMPTPQPPGSPITVARSGALHGALAHNLPAPLIDVRLFLVWGQRSEQDLAAHRARINRINSPDNALIARAAASSINEWKPGETLDLSTVFTPTTTPDAEDRLEQLVPRASSLFDPGLGAVQPEIPEDYERATLFAMLQPPDYTATLADTKKGLVARRQVHAMDLSPWFTQACLIIVGRIEDTDTPFPIYVGDREIKATGTTYLRWVYPLNNTAPRFDGLPLDAQPDNGAS